jgi:hypothetical protein
MTDTFYKATSPAGAGKTYATVQFSAKAAAAGGKILIAQNTKNLMNQTLKALRAHPLKPRARVFHSLQSRHETVASRIDAHMKAAVPDEGQIVIITHEALKRLPKSHRKFWDLIVDEIPSGYDHHELKIAKTHHIITDYLDASDELIPGLSVVKPSNLSAVEDLIINKTNDQLLAAFGKVLNAAVDPDRLLLVATDSYRDLMDNPETKGQVDFFSVLKDDFVKGFKSVTMLGAFADETSLFVLWEKMMNVTWAEHPELTKSLLYTDHQNGKRLALKYLFERRWSLKYSTLPANDEQSNIEAVAEFVDRYLDGREYLWHANEEQPDSLLKSHWRLPATAHGLDEPLYRNTHDVVLISALNHKPAVTAFFKAVGVDEEAAHTLISHQGHYQAMMRCSLRDPAAVAPVTVVVMSRDTAEWLAEKFPGSTVEKLDFELAGPNRNGRPPKPDKKPKAQYMRELRQRRKAEKAAELEEAKARAEAALK